MKRHKMAQMGKVDKVSPNACPPMLQWREASPVLRDCPRRGLSLVLAVAISFLGFFLLSASSAEATTKYWIGAAGGSFGSNANWSITSGGANNTTAPGSADVATFDSGANNNCAIDGAVNVSGMNITSTYIAIITQNAGAGNTITVGVSDWVQAGGTFTGGDATIGCNDAFTLSGGTFTSTTGTLTLVGNFTHTAGGTFNHSSGTVIFSGSSTNATADVNVTETFNHLTVNKPNAALTVTSGDTLVVAGTLTLTDGNINTGTVEAQAGVTHGAGFDGGTGTLLVTGAATRTITMVNGGQWPGVNLNAANVTVNGPVAGASNQMDGTLTIQAGIFNAGAGTLTLVKDFTHTAGGTFNHSSGTVVFKDMTVTGNNTFYNVTTNGFNSGLKVATGTTLTVTGTLDIERGWSDSATAGTIAAQGNIIEASTSNGSSGGANTLLINGTGDQTFTGNATRTAGGIPSVTINKPSGTLFLVGTIRLGRNWTYTSGILNPGTSTLIAVSTSTITGSHTLNAFIVDTNTSSNQSANIAASTVLTVKGTLTMDNTSTGLMRINGPGTITVEGDIVTDSTVGVSAPDSSNVGITCSGSNNQTVTGGTFPTGNFTIDKPTGTVTLGSNVSWGDASHSVTITAGTLDLAGFTLDVPGTLTNNGTILASGAGTPITAGTLTTGSAASEVKYTGVTADTAVTVKAGTYGKLTLDNSGTTFTLGGNVTAQGNLTVTAGTTLDASTSNYSLTVGGNFANGGTSVLRSGAVTLNGTNQAITGANTFFNLTKSVTAVDTLTFPAGVATTVNGTLTLRGNSANNPLFLVSSTPGTAALLTVAVTGNEDIISVNVKDNNASGGQPITAYNSVDSGNNTNWTFQALDLTTGLVAYYKLDNDANDSAGTNNGTATSVTYSTTFSPTTAANTHAAGFDGLASIINAGSAAALDDLPALSISAWIRPTTLGETGKGRIVEKSSSDASAALNGWYWGLEAGPSIYFRMDYATTDLQRQSSVGTITLGVWQHVVVTWDGSTSAANARIYINGVEAAYNVTTNAAGARVTDATQTLKIGNNNATTQTFDGLMDEVRLYSRALTASEVFALASQGGGGVLTLKDTDSLSTTLTNSTTVGATFGSLESNATAYVLSNTSGSFGGTTAITATPDFPPAGSAPISHILTTGDGDKTVYAQITRGGATYNISKSITLDATAPSAPSGLTLTANADNTGFTATATAPSSTDVTKLHWRYTAVDGNIAPTYPASHTAGTALGSGVSTGVTAGSAQSITVTSMTQLKTYGVRVWAEDTAGNVSTLNAQASLYLSPPTPRLVVTGSGSAIASTAGTATTLTITAKDANNAIITNYAGPYTLTWTPSGGSATTLVSASTAGFSSGATTTSVTVGGADAGLGTFTASDGSASALTNGTLSYTFYPAGFTVAADATSLTAGKAFNLTITAKDNAGTTMTRYAGTAALSLSATPTATKALSVTSMTITAGTSSVSLLYPDCASAATITGSDTTYVSGVTITGVTGSLVFSPSKFTVVVTPLLGGRTVWYLNEPVVVTVQALGFDNQVTPGYRGVCAFDAVSGMTFPSNYTFTAGDAGKHEFTSGIFGTTAGSYTISVKDSVATSAIGSAAALAVVEGKVIIADVSGSANQNLSVPVRVVNAATGTIIIDNTLIVRPVLTDPNGDGSATVTPAQLTLSSGQGALTVKNTATAEETVTVSATTTPSLTVIAGKVTTGSSTSSFTSFNLIQFESSYSGVFSYPTGSTYNYTYIAPPAGTTYTTQTYGTQVNTGLTTLQSSYSPYTAVISSPTGSSVYAPPSGSTSSVYSPANFSPAAFQAATSGLPPAMAASMMGSYFKGREGGMPSFEGMTQGSMPGWMSGGTQGGNWAPPAGMTFGGKAGEGGMPSFEGMTQGSMPGWMSGGMQGGNWAPPAGMQGKMEGMATQMYGKDSTQAQGVRDAFSGGRSFESLGGLFNASSAGMQGMMPGGDFGGNMPWGPMPGGDFSGGNFDSGMMPGWMPAPGDFGGQGWGDFSGQGGEEEEGGSEDAAPSDQGSAGSEVGETTGE